MLCSPRADTQTHRQTDTKVNTEDTLSGFQEFFLQPIIKDRSNKHNAELQRTAPDTQYKEAFSTRDRLFFFLFFVVTTGLDLVPDISIERYLHVHVVIQSC